MANHTVLSCVEETCCHIRKNSLPFGGIPIILLGDFQQTCPIIRQGTRIQIVDASIKSSLLWPYFTIMRLSIPIWQSHNHEFIQLLDNIGDGILDIVPLSMFTKVNSKEQLIECIYPLDILTNPEKSVLHSILAPTNAQVDIYNHLILTKCHGDGQVYYAADMLKEANDSGINQDDGILDYVATHTPPSMPWHALLVKKHCIYRLMRNFSIDRLVLLYRD